MTTETASKRSICAIGRTLRGDLRYQWVSRHFLYAAASFAAVMSAFSLGAYASARAAVDSLYQEWQFLHEDGGYTFQRAIGNGPDATDAPLKETWEAAGQAVAGLHPVQGAVNLLQVLCFVIGPIVFFTYGAVAATRDAHYKTLKFRVVREGRRPLFLSRAASLVTAVSVLTVTALLFALATTTAVHLTVSDRVDTRLLRVPQDMSFTDALPTLAMTVTTGVFFALLGMCAAVLFRRPLYVLPVFVAGFFLVPILSRFDPRNLLMALAYPHMEFIGGFVPPAPRPVGEFLAAFLLLLGVAGMLAVTYAVESRRSAYTT
ncbi:hypothetical protein ACIQMO_03180 [Streptomyces sp. NPDC091406]|uniref:hypothetical protein n=1 Tax=unclassified Streptomyces TaxID=2593676 RepID=UPI00382C0458